MSAEDRLQRLFERLPDDARAELQASFRNLAAVRSPRGAIEAIGVEIERLLRALVPPLARSPLPVRSVLRGRAIVAGAAGAAAALAEADELLIAFSAGAAAPSAAAVLAGLLVAWATELWVALSVRVHQLESAGREIDHDVLAGEIAAAMIGSPDQVITKRAAKRAARTLTHRLATRWAVGLTPGVGIAYDAFDAQRTVRSIARLPVHSHPPGIVDV